MRDLLVNVDKIKGRMVELRLSQEDISLKLGMNRSTFNQKLNRENGEMLTIKEANELLTILKIRNNPKENPFDYFFCSYVA